MKKFEVAILKLMMSAPFLFLAYMFLWASDDDIYVLYYSIASFLAGIIWATKIEIE